MHQRDAMSLNDQPVAAIQSMIGFQHRERRGVGFNRVETEQIRALVLMGLHDSKICQVMKCDHHAPNKIRKLMGVPRVVKMADYHPDRVHSAGGLCRSCYDIARRARPPSCHPDRPQYRSKGLCKECYLESRTLESASEHQENHKQ